jgi:hypothetical protein
MEGGGPLRARRRQSAKELGDVMVIGGPQNDAAAVFTDLSLIAAGRARGADGGVRS